MRGLVRYHGVIRTLPKIAMLAVSTATLGLNVLIFERLKQGEVLGVDRYGLLQLIILLGGLAVLLMREAGHRSTPWAQSLPVPARVLWTAHVRALVLAVSVVVGCMATVMVAIATVFREPGLMTPQLVAIQFVRPWLVLLAVAMMLGSWRGDLADPGRAAGWKRWRLILAVGAMVLLTLLTRAPLLLALLPVLAAATWARRVRAGLPPALGLAVHREGADADETAAGHLDGRRLVHWAILRQLFKWPATWIIGLPMVLLLGLVQGGAFADSVDADFARYFNVWISVYLMVAFVGHFLENLYRVDSLPISRDLLLRWLLVPAIVTLLVGGVVGTAMDLNRPPGESLVFENDTELPHHGLLVPNFAWQPVWGEPPQAVEAPWGEARPVASVPVVKGRELHLWKPYSTDAGASAEFVAWQISRAAEAVHGEVLDPQVIQDRYLVTGPDGAVEVTEGGLTLVADGLVPARRLVGPLLGLLMGFNIVLALLTCWLVFRVCGPGSSRRRVKTAFWSAMGVLMALHIGGYALLMTRTVKDWTVSALVGGFADRLASHGPLGWIGTWLLGLLLAVLAWRLCARAFARVEAVRGGSSCAL